MSALAAGIVGAVAAWFAVRWIGARLRTGAGDGTLEFAPFMERLGILQLLGVAVLVWVALSREHDSYTALIALTVALAIGGVYCLCEGIMTRGKVDDAGILFITPWGGKRHELWRDLRSVHYRAYCGMYVLKFRSGSVIRLSVLLSGHGAVLQHVRARGYHV
ncbi:hypothetical protein RBA41_18885 [Massilia sp. CCM 9210]|uniref:hypothetical protein n=1 Tax=Massilia scottii TaxID=3057166 RepID=UPI0027966086|nr:hypothetical protein [Massilia sp. CCM 9210]MDQ1815371.1 hypothetical protein [Massilia sp. CCM 9210]